MNGINPNSPVGAYQATARARRTGPIENIQPDPKPIKTEVDSLSEQTLHSLAQQAQVSPSQTEPKGKVKDKSRERHLPKENNKPQKTEVSGQDKLTGRSFSGTLDGPLLMEEAPFLKEAQGSNFRTVDFVFANPADFEDLRSVSLGLSGLEESARKSASSDQPVAFGSGESQYLFSGVQNGAATVQTVIADGMPTQVDTTSIATLPNGDKVEIARNCNGSLLSIRLPEASLSDLVEWGRGLLATA